MGVERRRSSVTRGKSPARPASVHTTELSFTALDPRFPAALLTLLFLASAWLVAIFEGAPCGPVVFPSADAPAFTMAHADAAKGHVERLAGMGVKVTGSAQAERDAPAYIIDVLLQIKARASAQIAVEIAVQRPSGSFNTDFLGGIAARYENVTNVICRISSPSVDGGAGRLNVKPENARAVREVVDCEAVESLPRLHIQPNDLNANAACAARSLQKTPS